MLDLTTIAPDVGARVALELRAIGEIFERQLASDLNAVNELCSHIERYRGKMLRPTLVVLSGLVAGDGHDSVLGPDHRTLGAVVEMIHMATLVHDDVLDEAEIRRRGATVNHLWGNEAAVMLGDYLISNAFHLCSSMGDPAINLALGRVTNTLCAGELLQLSHRGDLGLEPSTYYEIIRRKTASLIGEACRLGAWVAGADDDVAGALHEAGVAMGIAFQVQDDLLDLLGRTEVIGKPAGQDLAKGKLTLPVILHLGTADAVERAATMGVISAQDQRGLSSRLQDSGAVDGARAEAQRFVDEALAALERVPESGARDLMQALARQIVTRDR